MNDIVIALDETYHLQDNKPLYPHRFDKVQSFHFPPGYAPVISNGEAFFIDIEGKPVFGRKFKNVFGFYNGIATVVDEKGYFHIGEQGRDLHNRRFHWSGNFQENTCVVEDKETQHFFHINAQGEPLYTQKYAYVGDYRYGIAVTTNDRGLCTHIDKQGQLLHGQYFLELDVYHKGYAIAKDERGFFHVDKKGQALYTQRYLKLEPFYNDRAVAIDPYGVKKIISTQGCIVQVIEPCQIETQKIEHYYADQAFSYWSGRILASILELGVFDLLKYGLSVDDFRQQMGLPEKSIDMIVRWLIIHKLIILDKNTYSLTLAGKIILHKLTPIFSYWQSSELVTASLELSDSLKTHKSSFYKLYKSSFFEYIQEKKKLSEDIENVMNFYAIDYTAHLPYLNLSNEVVADIGGGSGILLNNLKEIYPNITPIVLDRYNYANIKHFKKMDLFKKWLVKADIYLLSRVLHDWDDDKAIILLKNINANMNRKTTLYVFETVVDERNIIDKGISLSFHLLNLLGGRERTFADFQNLFQRAGMMIRDIYLEDARISLMKAVKK